MVAGGFCTSRMEIVDRLIELLRLEPLANEGGFFRETYRCSLHFRDAQHPQRYVGSRSLCTAIYYLLSPDTFSAIHRLPGDEIFHFYLGDPIEMLQLMPDGSSKVVVVGPKVFDGMLPQVTVSGGVWQGSRLAEGGKFALLGTTMAPGFDFSDYEAGDRQELLRAYPDRADMIADLLR